VAVCRQLYLENESPEIFSSLEGHRDQVYGAGDGEGAGEVKASLKTVLI